MKKLIVALAAVAMTAGFAAKADECNQPCNGARQCDTPCADAPCPNTACDHQGAKFCPFDNLNLTDAQKQQFKELRDKAVKAKADSKAARKNAKKECKRQRLEEIKKILTPEQYVMFLENHFVNGGGNKIAHHRGHDMRPHKAHRRVDQCRAVEAAKLAPAKKVDKKD